jgi:hypothetical protein
MGEVVDGARERGKRGGDAGGGSQEAPSIVRGVVLVRHPRLVRSYRDVAPPSTSMESKSRAASFLAVPDGPTTPKWKIRRPSMYTRVTIKASPRSIVASLPK